MTPIATTLQLSIMETSVGFICADIVCVCVGGGGAKQHFQMTSKQNWSVWNEERDGVKNFRRSINLVEMRMVRTIDTLYVKYYSEKRINTAAHFCGTDNNLDINHCWKSC